MSSDQLPPNMIDDATFASLLEQTYAAALDPTAWTRLLDALEGAYGGTVVIERWQASDGASASDEGAAMDADAGAPLAQAEAMSSFMSRLVEPRDGNRNGSPVGLRGGQRTVPLGGDSVGLTLARDEGLTMQLTLTRPKTAGGFSPDELARWQQLVPHIQRAVRIRQEIAAAGVARDSALQCLTALAVGVAIVDEDGRVLFMNEIAETIFRRGDGLVVRQGRVRPTTLQLRDSFLKIVRDAARSGPLQADAGELLPLPRTPPARPLAALISPLPASAAGAGLEVPAALIFLGDLSRDAQAREKDLIRLYGLTTAEAKLLGALLGGAQLADHAASMGISVNTVKTHLRQIFGKTGYSRQTDLLRAIFSDPILWLAAVWPSTHPD